MANNKKNLNLTVDSEIIKALKKIALRENSQVCNLFEELFLTHTGKIQKGKLLRDKQVQRLTLYVNKEVITNIKEYCITNDITVSDLVVYLFDDEFNLSTYIPDYQRIH